MAHYDGFNDAYAEYFGADGPIRTTVAAEALPHPHQLLMIQAVAHVPIPAKTRGTQSPDEVEVTSCTNKMNRHTMPGCK